MPSPILNNKNKIKKILLNYAYNTKNETDFDYNKNYFWKGKEKS